MSATATMPYFIKPSINLEAAEKKEAYERALLEINAILEGESHFVLKMVTINCLLKTHLPYYYWTGFLFGSSGKTDDRTLSRDFGVFAH